MVNDIFKIQIFKRFVFAFLIWIDVSILYYYSVGNFTTIQCSMQGNVDNDKNRSEIS